MHHQSDGGTASAEIDRAQESLGIAESLQTARELSLRRAGKAFVVQDVMGPHTVLGTERATVFPHDPIVDDLPHHLDNSAIVRSRTARPDEIEMIAAIAAVAEITDPQLRILGG